MKITHFKFKKLIVYFFILLPTLTYASWPSFAAPDKEFLLANHYLTEDQCPPGKVRLVPHPVINIQHTLCKSYCPNDWVWVGVDDGQCHEIKNIHFQKYEITHVSGADDVISHSMVTASYGEGAFTFIFTSGPGEHWYCIQENPDLHFVMCANDI